MIQFKYIEDNMLYELVHDVNDYCENNKNVLDVQIFQNFAKYFDNLRTDGYVAIIKERLDND